MSATLTGHDLARVESTARALLSPLALPDVPTWQRTVNAELRGLLGGEHALFRLPTGEGTFYTDDGEDIVHGLMTFAQQVTPEMIRYWDEAPNVWHTDRRTLGIEAFTYDDVSEVVRRGGLSVERAPVWNEVFFRNRVHDYAGLITTRPEGDAILWALGPRLGHGDAAAQRAMLRILVPAFKAGLDALDRLDRHRAALDVVSEPLAVFGADGRETHRNPALRRLLDPDPERDTVEAGLRALAARARVLVYARRGEHADPTKLEVEVRTGHARYRLRPAFLGPTGAGYGEAFVVTVEAGGLARLPSLEAVRARHGLSKREAEVALLVAQGLSNAEIAGRLYVSPHTVRHHVEAVLLKLDLTGRGRGAVTARLLGAESDAS